MSATDAGPGSSVTPRRLDRGLRWGGIVLHIAIGVFPVAATGLLAPPVGYIAIWVLWAVLLAFGWRLGRTRPRLVPLVPVAMVALWFLILTLGESLLGWTA